MLSAGLRLLLALAAPLLGAATVHELRAHRRTCVAITATAAVGCAALALTLTPALSAGGSLERSFGSPVPGVTLTARADAASVAVMLIACLATLLALPRHRGDGERLAGTLLCLTGAALVAAAGNLALVGGGVEVVAAGTLLLRGRHGPGSRSTALLAALLAWAGLALVASAAQLVAGAGSSDLAFVPETAINPAVALPWAAAGAAMLASPALLGEGGWPDRDWAAIAALPTGFLVLLRLQLSAGGRLPVIAAVALATAGALVAVVAALRARRAATLASAGRAAVGVLVGALVSIFASPLGDTGTVLAGLFLAIELAMLAAPSWSRQPTAWSAASVALLVLPGGASFAVVAVGLGTVARRGPVSFLQLVVLAAAVAMSAVAAARALVAAPRSRGPLLPGAAIAVAAGTAGGFLPGAAVRVAATPLAGGATTADLDAGALALPGGAFAGGYLAAATALLLVSVVAATVVAGDVPSAAAVPRPLGARLPLPRWLLRLRRGVDGPLRRSGSGVHQLDHWLEGQPGVAFLLLAVVLALLLIH